MAAKEITPFEDEVGEAVAPLEQPIESRPLRELLDELVDVLRRYVVMRREGYDAIALWAAETYVQSAFDIAPYLEITSPIRRCGKSLLLDILRLVVYRPWPVIDPSESTLFRKIDRDHPTLLLDELDTLFGKPKESTEGIRAVLNVGHRRGGTVPRCVPPTHEVRDFDVFGPKAFAGIFGNTPDTIADRSIVIQLHRRTRAESIQRFRYRRVRRETDELRVAFGAWGERVGETIIGHLGTAEKLLEDELAELGDRAGDTWEPLLCVALEAGEEWKNRAVAAALALSDEEASEEVVGVLLLTHVAQVIAEKFPPGVRFFPTRDLLSKLYEIEEAPWADFANGRPLSQERLARLLRPYGVRTRQVRMGRERKRGVDAELIERAIARYVEDAVDEPVEASAPSIPVEPVTPVTPVTDGKPEADFPLGQANVTGVTGVTGLRPHSRRETPTSRDRRFDPDPLALLEQLDG